MARSKTPEAMLAAEAHRKLNVLVFYSPVLLSEGKPHILLYGRRANLAALHTVAEARAWLRLHGTATG